VRAQLLGQFNAYNLFHGGYALMTPPETGSIYLVQRHPLAAVPAGELLQQLAGFAERAANAGA
jgi:hypothetical protein